MKAKGKLNMALRLIMMVVIVRAEVFTTVVDVHKSFVSWWSWWGNGARFAAPVPFFLLNFSVQNCRMKG